MAQFSIAFDYVIRNEDSELSGIVINEPNGGKARFGVNSVFHPRAVIDNFYTMSRDSAFRYCVKILQREYWDKKGFAELDDQRLATKLFDMAVNMGNGGEFAILQSTLELPISHRLDDQTIDAIKQSKPNLLKELIVTLKAHYLIIYQKNPVKYRSAITGWLTRAAKLPK